MADEPYGEGFWIVWNPQGQNPQFRHSFEGDAVREAERLARLNPGQTFIVLETVCSRCVDGMQRTGMRPLPF